MTESLNDWISSRPEIRSGPVSGLFYHDPVRSGQVYGTFCQKSGPVRSGPAAKKPIRSVPRLDLFDGLLNSILVFLQPGDVSLDALEGRLVGSPTRSQGVQLIFEEVLYLFQFCVVSEIRQNSGNVGVNSKQRVCELFSNSLPVGHQEVPGNMSPHLGLSDTSSQ